MQWYLQLFAGWNTFAMLIFAFDEPWLGSGQSVGISPTPEASTGKRRRPSLSVIESWYHAERASKARLEKPVVLSPKIRIFGFSPVDVGSALGSGGIGAMRDGGTGADGGVHLDGGMGDDGGGFITGARCMNLATRRQPFEGKMRFGCSSLLALLYRSGSRHWRPPRFQTSGD